MDGVKEKKLLLSIEIISGGISLFSDGTEIGFRSTVRESGSKTESILSELSELLTENQIEKSQIEKIVVSKGEGSLTGGKIGLAISKGLSRAFGCPLVEVSALKALLLIVFDQPDGEYMTAIGIGKNRFHWQIFVKQGEIFEKKISEIQVGQHEDFKNQLESFKGQKIIFDCGLPEICEPIFDLEEANVLFNKERRLSYLCGRMISNASDKNFNLSSNKIN